VNDAVTPYRGDGRPVILNGMRSFRRSLAQSCSRNSRSDFERQNDIEWLPRRIFPDT
jgi:hypothetical protein